MLSISHLSSPARNGPTIGLASVFPAESRFGSSRSTAVAVRSVLSCHTAVASSATSTTTPFPVRSRAKSAAATPPASIAPLGASPNAPRGITSGAPGAVRMSPTPPRDQKLIASNPPRSASGPRWPWPWPFA